MRAHTRTTRAALLLLASAALTLGACKRNDAGNVTTNAVDMGANAVDMSANAVTNSMTSAPLTAQDFANAAAASDRFEIESSKLAATSAKSDAVKAFARQMISAHTGSTQKLKTIASGMNPPLTPNDTLNPDQQALLDGLKGKTGADFDAAYASAQVTAHQKTLDALKGYAASGDNAQLQAFATSMVPIVTAHLNLAKGLS